MDSKLNTHKIKALRKRHLWSQEELATASGLSLRTIQRAEGEGRGSIETLKSLAATFDVEHETLVTSPQENSSYLNVQLGYVTIGAMLTVSLAAVLALSMGWLVGKPFWALVFVSGLLACLFATLTTRVKDGQIMWHFGPGLISKVVDVDAVQGVRAVRNKGWWGWGIRLIPNGWLYNVSGFDAVELSLKSGRQIRIGTDDPNGLAVAIQNAMERVNHA